MAWYYAIQRKNETSPIKLEEKKEHYESPFQIIPALQFSLLIIFIKFISSLGKIYQDIIPLQVSSYIIGLFS